MNDAALESTTIAATPSSIPAVTASPKRDAQGVSTCPARRRPRRLRRPHELHVEGERRLSQPGGLGRLDVLDDGAGRAGCHWVTAFITGRIACPRPGLRFETRLLRFVKTNRFRRDDVFQRLAWDAGEHLRINFLRVFFARQNQAAARAAQGFVRGGRHKIRVLHRAGMNARRDEAGDVRNVRQQIRADLAGDLAHAFEINHARIALAPTVIIFGRARAPSRQAGRNQSARRPCARRSGQSQKICRRNSPCCRGSNVRRGSNPSSASCRRV